jgi:hypothetical protein
MTMKHITDIVKPHTIAPSASGANGPKSGESQRMTLAEQRAARLWTVMHSFYGSLWVSSHGSKPDPIWIGQLADVTDEQCTTACNALIRLGRKLPPSLPEFIELCCARAPGVRYLGCPTTPDCAAALDAKPASPERAAEWIANIRAKLGIRTPTHRSSRDCPDCDGAGCDTCGEWKAPNGELLNEPCRRVEQHERTQPWTGPYAQCTGCGSTFPQRNPKHTLLCARCWQWRARYDAFDERREP